MELKEKISELEGQREADQELLGGMRERLQQMEAELADYKEIAEQTCNVSSQPVQLCVLWHSEWFQNILQSSLSCYFMADPVQVSLSLSAGKHSLEATDRSLRNGAGSTV